MVYELIKRKQIREDLHLYIQEQFCLSMSGQFSQEKENPISNNHFFIGTFKHK